MENIYLVQRYKNLATDNAIDEHKKIISEAEYVWGGWWAHSDEYLPLEKVSLLKTLSNDKSRNGISVFLLNSETNEVFTTVVKDLHFSVDRERIESPDPKKTPIYYSNHKCLLWMKIVYISDAGTHDSIFRDYTYCDYEAFQTSNQYNYTKFNRKKVSNIKELSSQPRTIFFLRDSQENDEEFDIEMLFSTPDTSSISQDYCKVTGNKILMLSDLHFSNDNKRFAFNDCMDPVQKNKKSLAESLKEVFPERAFDIASMIIAGDVTFNGDQKEYAFAEKFIYEVINYYKMERKHITIIPGNHDIQFSSTEYKERDPIDIDYADVRSKANYENFYKKIYGIRPNTYLSIGKKLLLKNCLPVDIVGINSNCLQQDEKHFKGMGFVGKNQLNLIEDEMDWGTNDYSYKILVLHHHIHPVENEEPIPDYAYSISLDAGYISSFIVRNKINLVVHGHKHKEHFIKIGNIDYQNKRNGELYSYYVLGLGSVSSTCLAHNTQNSTAIIDFSEFGSAIIRIYPVNNSINDNSKPIFEQRLPLW
jgi:predicted phosphodiesterase